MYNSHNWNNRDSVEGTSGVRGRTKSWTRTHSFVWIVMMALAVPVSAQTPTEQGDVFDQFFRYTEKENRVLFEEIPGETIDPFTGTLRLVQTDLVLPGKAGHDVRIVRSYSSKIWGRTDLLDAGPLLAEKEQSVLGYGWTMHMGRLRNPYFNGFMGICSSNLPVFEDPDGTSRVFYPTVSDGTVYMSKDYWRLERGCTFPGSVGSTICVWSDKGMRYEFDHSAEFWTGTTEAWPASNIVDVFGNTISMTYLGNTGAINRITDTYYRYIDFSYKTDVDGLRLESIFVNYKAYYYSYTAYTTSQTGGPDRYPLNGMRRFLTTVTPPAGPSYLYEYGYNLPVSQNQYALSKVTYPSGGSTSYVYESAPFYTGRQSVPFAVVSRRTVSGRGLPEATWTYSYNSPAPGAHTTIDPVSGEGTDLSVTAILRPDGHQDTYRMYGFGYLVDLYKTDVTWAAGLTYEIARGDRAEVESIDWRKGQSISNGIYAAPAYSTGCAADADHWLWDYGVFVPVEKTRTLYRNPVTEGYSASFKTENDDFDAYGQPRLTTETGYNGGITTNGQVPPPLQRVTNRTYFSEPSVNILRGRPLTQHTCIASECLDNAWTYSGPNYSRNSETVSGVTTTFGYDQYGNLATVTNALGQRLALSNYEAGFGTPLQIDFNGAFSVHRTTSWEGWILTETNGRGFTTAYEYDGIGRLKKVTPPIGNATGYTYDEVGGSWTNVARGDYHQLSQLDGLGRVISMVDSEGVQTSVRYDSMGRAWFKSYPYDTTTKEAGEKLEFDALGRVIVQTKGFDPNTGTCDAPGACRVISSYLANCTNAIVERTAEESTANPSQSPSTWHCSVSYGDPNEKRLTQVEDAGWGIWEYVYNTAGKLTAITAPLRHGNRSFGYDARQFLISETSGESGTITYGRNTIGQVTSRRDARLVTATYDYATDPLGRLRSIRYLNGSEEDVSRDYDNANNVTHVSSANGGSFDYVYDEVNRLTRQTWYYGGWSYVTTYQYDNAGCLNLVTYPSGAALSMVCDTANRVTEASLTINGVETLIASGIVYHPSGQVKTVTYGNGRTTAVTYDDRARVRTLAAPNLVDLGYQYDGTDNVLSFCRDPGDSSCLNNIVAPDWTRVMVYDALNRLVVSNAPNQWGSYTYDALGNRSNKSTDAAASTYSYESATGRLVFASGPPLQPQTMTFTWDVANRLASSSDGTTYRYDGHGRRIQKADASQTTVYHYDAAGRVLAETLPDGTKLRDYIYLGNKLIAVDGCMEGVNSSGCNERQWYHTDTLGSVLARTSNTGAVVAQFDYRPWGEQLQVTGVQGDRQYNGRVYDSGTGFHDYGARLYWPEIGRFISVDAAGPNLGSPATFNRYSYVLNNPYKYVDPTGHFSVMPSIWGKEGGPAQWFAKWFCTEMAKQSLDERLPWIDRAQAAVAGTIVSLLDVEAVEKTGMVLGLAGSLRVVNERPTIDSRTGEEIGRFVADPNGNTMIEPVGGTTQAAGRGGVDTHTTYPNGSNYQRLNPQGHANNPTPHAHGHAKGTGPGMKGQGPSLSPDGRQVPANSSDAHWPVN